MHRYREFGIVSEQDELFRRAFRDGFQLARGLSHAQFSTRSRGVATMSRRAPTKRNSPRRSRNSPPRAAARRGQRDSVVDLYRAVRDQGLAAVVTAPRPEDDRATLARADELMRRDPARYWGDGELQDAAFEARERLGDAGGARRGRRRRPRRRSRRRARGGTVVAPAQGAAAAARGGPRPAADRRGRVPAAGDPKAATDSAAIGTTPDCARTMRQRSRGCMAVASARMAGRAKVRRCRRSRATAAACLRQPSSKLPNNK